MPNTPVPAPDNLPALGDPGDETANRFRFQWAWAAIVCCMVLDETLDVEEVFCEHHEDVLIRHQDGTFTGHQVKTRGNDQPLWKAEDQAVLSACSRFSQLESEFPGKFRHYCFLSNHPLHSSGNGKDLGYILELIKEAASITDLPDGIARWVKRIAREARVSETIAFSALSITVVDANLPKLRDTLMRLIDTIAQCWSSATDCSHDALKRAAKSLIEECCNASSLNHYQLLPAYLLTAIDPDGDMRSRIEGKRMTRERINRVLEIGRDSAATLDGDPNLWVRPGEGSPELLRKKLQAGGFSSVAMTSAEDLRNKADYLGLTWIQKYGRDTGLGRYNHIRSLVLSDAGRAFDASQIETDGFGPIMREDLRSRLHQRTEDRCQIFDCTVDHLEGIAFTLTAQCKITWSHARPWELQ